MSGRRLPQAALTLVVTLAMMVGLAVFASSAAADTVGTYRSLHGANVRITTQTGGTVAVAITGLSKLPTTGNARRCEVLVYVNRNSPDGFWTGSGTRSAAANGSWSGKVSSIPAGDHHVFTLCDSDETEGEFAGRMTDPAYVPVTLSQPAPGTGNNWQNTIAKTGRFAACLGGFALVALPVVIAFYAGGPVAVKNIITSLFWTPYQDVAAGTTEACFDSVLNIKIDIPDLGPI